MEYTVTLGQRVYVVLGDVEEATIVNFLPGNTFLVRLTSGMVSGTMVELRYGTDMFLTKKRR